MTLRFNPAARAFGQSAVIAVCLGTIAFWGSENLFWSAPAADLGIADLVLTPLAYSVAVAAAHGAVIWSGLRGWRGLFLGGALLGWLVEGVLVGTAYDAFPFQLVWTPLAWHAVITALSLGIICRAAPRWPLWRHLAALTALGLFGGAFAQLWPLERGEMPGLAAVTAYLAGIGVVVPVANIVLDRMAQPVSVTWLHRGAWLLAVLVWAGQSAVEPSPLRLSVPVLIAVTLWAMRQLGRSTAAMTDKGPLPSPLWRHGLFLFAPLMASGLAVLGWQRFGGIEIWPVALILSALVVILAMASAIQTEVLTLGLESGFAGFLAWYGIASLAMKIHDDVLDRNETTSLGTHV